MRKQVIIRRDVIRRWLRNDHIIDFPSRLQCMTMALTIASRCELHEYRVSQLTARMLPDGNVRVTGPEESKALPVDDTWFLLLCGFLVGVIVTEAFMIIAERVT